MVRVRWPGWGVALALGLAPPASAQERPPPLVELRENTPNPFFPTTTIPFVLHPELCERGHQPLVSLRVYNVLAQVVAIPILQNSNGERLDGLRLRCGNHEAFWDGRQFDTSWSWMVSDTPSKWSPGASLGWSIWIEPHMRDPCGMSPARVPQPLRGDATAEKQGTLLPSRQDFGVRGLP
jgi:hypothetical protein